MTYQMDTVFESESGHRRLSKRQLGYGAWKQGVSVKRIENGFLVDGERYERISY